MDYSLDVLRYLRRKNGVTKTNIKQNLSLSQYEVDTTLQRLKKMKFVRSEEKDGQTKWYAIVKKGV